MSLIPGEEPRSATDAPLFEYRRGGRRLTVWPGGMLEHKDGLRRIKRISLVGAEAISVDYEGDGLPVLIGRGKVFTQETVVTVQDRLGKTTRVSIPWAMPLNVKRQLEEVAAGFVGKVASSLAAAGARLLATIADEPPADQTRGPPRAELLKHAEPLQARLAADGDDGAALQAARRNPKDQAALRALTTAIHHRAELEPAFHDELAALVGQAEQSGPARWLDVAAGAGLGLAAAATAALGWLLTVVTTHTQYVIFALLVGFLVGRAVVLGSGAARSRRLQVVSMGVTLLGLTASQYLIGRHFLAKFVAEEGGGSVPVLLDLDDAITLVRDSLVANPRILVFWALALWPACRIPASRKRAGQALRLPATTSRPWQAVGLAAGTIILVGLGVSVAVMGTAGDRSRAGLRMVINDLQVGHCYEQPKQNEVGIVDVVPCNQSHDGEVFAIVRLREPKLPAEVELERLTDRVCTTRFPEYVGVALRDSKLNFGWWAPTKESWADGDRTLVCVLEDPNRQRLIGSMRGTRR